MGLQQSRLDRGGGAPREQQARIRVRLERFARSSTRFGASVASVASFEHDADEG